MISPPATSEAAPPASGAAATPGSTASGIARSELPLSDEFRTERTLDQAALSLAPGRAGRLAVIADESGQAVPWRFEKGKWERLELPEAHRAAARDLFGGMYFGRDDRPRLMGYATSTGGVRMLYLRYKDGGWRPEPTEIGRLAAKPEAELFGILGWDDPEIVCKSGDVCLIKSRAGWLEIEPTLPPTQVVRAFGGRGYALTEAGLFRADKNGFARVGPPASWKTPATGFWVGDDDSAVVVEPATDTLHTLAPGASVWEPSPSPIDAPADVSGPEGARFVVGAGGIAYGGPAEYRRVGDPAWRLSFVLELEDVTVAAGASGVVRITPSTPD